MNKRVVAILLVVQDGMVAAITAGPYLRLPCLEHLDGQDRGVTDAIDIARKSLGFGIAAARVELRVATRDGHTVVWVAKSYHHDSSDEEGMGVRWVPYDELRGREMWVDYDHNLLPIMADILENHYSEVGK